MTSGVGLVLLSVTWTAILIWLVERVLSVLKSQERILGQVLAELESTRLHREWKEKTPSHP